MMNWLTEHTLLPADTWLLVLAGIGAMCIGMSKAGLGVFRGLAPTATVMSALRAL